MTDSELIAKKLALIETCVSELRRLSDIEKLESDLREQRFVEHTLQIAIQAAIDAASHVVSDERLGEPGSYRELFRILVDGGYLPEMLGRDLENMTGFRNVLVHGYDDVDLKIVRDIVENHLDDLLDFASRLRALL